ncbi:hypothetical protein [Halomonas sp. GFAJ-1]|uniref:hypothetical protein n=1 Tax=Halomonas sp. GFAJ-1 TaxID=1118153 RepID=UPI00023A4690|nr:hypothetical protein [Halomonas sp. GFAJ-1]AVI62919.1 hypothetical protein BB497_09525 [Halomonas sp. GFAJ-1]EHK62040.1 hypothetical protein MOY_03443 [Halomonas sp. GFAJ-1]
MSQLTSSSLPPRKPRQDNPLGRMIAEALDNLLLRYAHAGIEFTIPEARNDLSALPDFADTDKTQLRYYVRDRLHTLERLGLATRVGVMGENRAIFRLHLEVVEAECTQQTTDNAPQSPGTHRSSNDNLLVFLEKDRQHLSTRMQIAVSEAEYYKKVLDQYPDEKARISPLLETALEKSSRLKGEWDANVTLRSQLASQGKPS